MAFKKLKVKVGQVTGTHTNFPTLIQPSLITGLGSITLAEAQSARFYSDVGKTTEIAREIVSADEIHVKVTSMEALAEIWMDYDGIRSDYATTDTYGAEAVWGDYSVVYHFDENTGTLGADSSGNFDSTLSTSSLWSSGGKIGNAVAGSSSQRITSGFSVAGFSALTAQMWLTTPTSLSTFQVAQGQNASSDYNFRLAAFSGALQADFNNAAGTPTRINLGGSTGTYHLVHMTWDGTTAAGFRDGVSKGTSALASLRGSSIDFSVLNRDGSSNNPWQGTADEIRVSPSHLSANWIETEYNNQNANGSFWEATDAGGGAAAQAARRGVIMMM